MFFPRLFLFVGFLLVSSLGATIDAQQLVVMENAAPPEQHPVLRADGGELFFSRIDNTDNQGKDNAADIWIRGRNPDGSWGRALNPGSPVNSFAHDRALALNSRGDRIVVLRRGATNYIDLLERKQRNWRIAATWPLPEDAASTFDLTFDLNGQRIVYSKLGSNGVYNLYEREALTDGEWSEEEELTLLNGTNDTTNPQMAADGRTLYFRQDRQWWYQSERDLPAVPSVVSSLVKQVSVSAGPEEPAIAVEENAAGQNQLLKLSLSGSGEPIPAELTRGYLSVPPAPGNSVAAIRLASGKQLMVYPDKLQRYEVFLRPGEEILTDANNATAANSVGNPGNQLADTGPPGITDAAAIQQLESNIAARELALRQLSLERRRYDQAVPRETDPELEALRSRYAATTGAVDTLPPTGHPVRDKYARELRELEQMKAKFRRQQEDKLRQRSGSRSHYWTDKSTTPASVPNAQPQAPVPGIGEVYTPAPVVDPRQQAYQKRQDSLRYGATVRSGLYPDRQPAAYEREAWENQVRQDLPRQEALTPQEAARLDREYQRQQQELAAMRDKLQRMQAPATGQEVPASWSAKSTPEVYATPATSTPVVPYGHTAYPPATTAPSAPRPVSTVPGVAAGISFIENTAYPDGAGYAGLDQLVRQLNNQVTGVLEVRVHTSAELDRRAAQLLSEERALSIRNYLLEQSVPAHLFKVIGFGNNLTGSGGERVEVLR